MKYLRIVLMQRTITLNEIFILIDWNLIYWCFPWNKIFGILTTCNGPGRAASCNILTFPLFDLFLHQNHDIQSQSFWLELENIFIVRNLQNVVFFCFFFRFLYIWEHLIIWWLELVLPTSLFHKMCKSNQSTLICI